MIIVGAGYMGVEYAKVLDALHVEYYFVCRAEDKASSLKDSLGVTVYSGGLEHHIKTSSHKAPEQAIVCVPVDSLYEVTRLLLEWGVKDILVEKPGALSLNELRGLRLLEKEKSANVLIAYNRRFYASVIELKRCLNKEKLTAVNFEISEWAHVVADDSSSEATKQKWFLANTSHVVDLAFFIAGKPDYMHCYSSGSLPWHSSGARFSGSGMFPNDVVFSYFGYWDCPGRWSLEFVTNMNRYILRPMEKLQVQKIGSVAINDYTGIGYDLDTQYKPGLYKQVEAFLSKEMELLCSVEEQILNFSFYERMANYASE